MDFPLRKTNTILNRVPPEEVHIVERFGKFRSRVDAGLYLTCPFIDSIIRVDQREMIIRVDPTRPQNPDLAYMAAFLSVKVSNSMMFVYGQENSLQQLYNQVRFEMEARRDLTPGDMIESENRLRKRFSHTKDTYGVEIVRC